MFKKVQNYLLIQHPLLWNTKIVPAFSLAIVLHILFFIIGYLNGKVTFSERQLLHYSIDTEIVVFFSILVSLLFFVIWFIYLNRNNAFRAFYPTAAKSLYLQWLILLCVCLLNITYAVSYSVGKSLKTRSYYSENEAHRRLSTISMADIFIDGSLNPPPPQTDAIGSDLSTSQQYPPNSLFYRSAEYFYNFNKIDGDSIVKNWMKKNDQAAIRKLMHDYMQIVREHGLPTNLTAESWFEKTYDFPTFSKYEVIGRRAFENDDDVIVTTTYEQDYKYYLPQAVLLANYGEINNAWQEPLVAEGLLYTLLYTALSLAMMLFSFRVTNGRNWLLALLIMGGLWIVAGLFSTFARSETTFLYFWFAILIVTVAYLWITIDRKRGKENSGIVLNLLLWSAAGILPLLYFLIMEYYNQPRKSVTDGIFDYVNTPQHQWLNDNMATFLIVNFWNVVVAMFGISIYVKRWKAIAES